MTEQQSSNDRFFDALDESFEAMLGAAQKGQERGSRLSKRLLRDVEEGQRELTRLGRRFARKPRDMRGIYRSSVDLARRAASDSAALAQELVSETTDASQNVRQTAQQIIRANRAAADALAAALRGAATDLTERARRRAGAAAGPKPAGTRKSGTRRAAPRRTKQAKDG